MIPRAVLMAKAVVDAGVDTEEVGNILAPVGKSWANNSVNYYTNSIPGLWSQGSPFMGQPRVSAYDPNGYPLYSWFPVNPRLTEFFYDRSPVDSIAPAFGAVPFPPPIGTLDPYLP